MASTTNGKTLKQVTFLQKILENKEVLFGKFSNIITKNLKKEKWIELRNFTVSIGLITNDKEYSFVRDNTWGNLRKRTMGKIDNMKCTGTGGGPNAILNEIDDLVLQIIGKESPVIFGFGVSDSFEDEPDFPDESNDPSTSVISDANPAKKRKKVIVAETGREHTETPIEKLKRQKLELQVKHLQLLNYKLELEIAEKEKELGIFPVEVEMSD